jgi:hypothetical protein
MVLTPVLGGQYGGRTVGEHDAYGKQVMRVAAGVDYHDWGEPTYVHYGAGMPARIDGAVGSDIAVEIESRVSKQIRGAILDLVCHSYPKKLLVLLPVHMADAEVAAAQARNIMARFMPEANFRVLVLQGSGRANVVDGDATVVKAALRELGYVG